MRLYGILCVVIALILILTPLSAVSNKQDYREDTTIESNSHALPENTTQTTTQQQDLSISESIDVLAVAKGQVITMPFKEYLIGVVAAEMPAVYHKEALKAQAVAAYTYAIRSVLSERQNPTPTLQGAAITDDNTRHQGYLTLEQMKEKWGEDFDNFYNKIKDAVDEVENLIVAYQGSPALTVFHAISSGKTEAANTFWAEPTPYLVPVESEGDPLSPQYSTSTVLTKEKFAEIAKTITGVTLDDDAALWVGEIEKTESGTVTSIVIGGVSLTGAQVRAYYSLRSPAFTITYANNSFTFKTTGYGHGVGMSQYGSDYYARKGMTYDEILKHYYSNTDIIPYPTNSS